jgi:hypothetical protein
VPCLHLTDQKVQIKHVQLDLHKDYTTSETDNICILLHDLRGARIAQRYSAGLRAG